jgi:hypothetical protein
MMLRVLACALVLAAVAAFPAYGVPTKATLSLSGNTVRGAHFHAREKVRIRMTTSTTVVRTVRASAAGTFAVVAVPHDPCMDAMVITAIGATGDTARLKVMPRACPPSNGTP